MTSSELAGGPNLDHVGISMATYIGQIVEPGDVIDIDRQELLNNLIELGEFKHTVEPPELKILIATNLSSRQGIYGYARPISKKRPYREAVVELFQVVTQSEYFASYDHNSDLTNEVLLHELKHAVDFQDRNLWSRHVRYKKIDSLGKNVKYGAMALASLAVGVLPDAGTEKIGVKMIDTAFAALGLWYVTRIRKTDKAYPHPHGYSSWRKYEGAPLEARAFSLIKELVSKNSLPQIVQYHI